MCNHFSTAHVPDYVTAAVGKNYYRHTSYDCATPTWSRAAATGADSRGSTLGYTSLRCGNVTYKTPRRYAPKCTYSSYATPSAPRTGAPVYNAAATVALARTCTRFCQSCNDASLHGVASATGFTTSTTSLCAHPSRTNTGKLSYSVRFAGQLSSSWTRVTIAFPAYRSNTYRGAVSDRCNQGRGSLAGNTYVHWTVLMALSLQ